LPVGTKWDRATKSEKAISDVASPDKELLATSEKWDFKNFCVKRRSLIMCYGGFILEKLMLYYNQSELIRNDHA